MLVSPGFAHFDALAVGVWVLDTRNVIVFANGAAAALAGNAPAVLPGWDFLDLVAPDGRDAAAGFLAQCHAGDAQADLPIRDAAGTVHWALVTRAAADPLGHLILIGVDISERKRAERQLRQAAAHYRVLTDTAQDHIFVIDRDDRVEFVNIAAAAQFRTTPEQVIGRQRTEIFPPEIAEKQARSLKRVFDTGQSFHVENPARYAGGEVWLSTSLAPVYDERGQTRAVLGVSRDVTARKRAETELSNAAKLEAIGRLAGGIAHDFNNNLTAILGYVEMLRAEVTDPRVAADLNEVRLAAERAAGLVRRLLAFGRKQVVQPRSLDLGAVIAGVTPMLQRLIGERVQVEVRIDEDLEPVTGDPGELEQIVMNLALNARDAMPRGGTLTIAAKNVAGVQPGQPATLPPGIRVQLSVRDTGIGMDESTRERVFDPFFTTKPIGEGTGLGLSTVYGIVKQLNGYIWVESAVGAGATFTVSLPAAETSPLPPAVEEEEVPSELRRATILLVEDEPTVLRFAKTALQLHGFTVLEAATPAEAMAIAERERDISLLLTDVVMPHLSGPELAARLRRVRPELAVLYMSGYPAGLVLREQLDPAMRLISKPFKVADLITAVNELLV